MTSYYCYTTIVPIEINIDHDVKPSHYMDSNVVFSLLIIAAVLSLAMALKKKEYHIFPFSIFWFFINMAPFLMIRLNDFMAERWVYLASIGFSIALAEGLILISNAYKRTGIVAIVTVISFLGVLTPLRNQVYASWTSLWENTVQKAPDNPDPYLNLSVAYRQSGNPVKAIENAYMAIKKGEKRGAVPIIAYINLSAAYEDIGEYEKAVEALKPIESYSANYYKYYHNLGCLYMKMQRCETALPLLKKAIEIQPNAPGTYYAMGECYENLSQDKKAKEYFKLVTESVPQSGQDYIFQGVAFSELEDKERAIESFFEAVKADPLDVDVRIFLARALLESGQYGLAFKHYSIASQVSPNYAPAYTGMGKAMLAKGNLKEARKHFNKALSLLSPDSPDRKEILELLTETQG